MRNLPITNTKDARENILAIWQTQVQVPITNNDNTGSPTPFPECLHNLHENYSIIRPDHKSQWCATWTCSWELTSSVFFQILGIYNRKTGRHHKSGSDFNSVGFFFLFLPFFFPFSLLLFFLPNVIPAPLLAGIESQRHAVTYIYICIYFVFRD